MVNLMIVLLVISLGLLLIGIVQPSVSLFWSNQTRTRSKSAIIYSVLSIAFFICFGINLDATTQVAVSPSTDTVATAKAPDLNDPLINSHLFDYPQAMVMVLSKNGIGKLSPWSNRLDLGWGSLTGYHLFGNASKTGVQNNLAYYLEGTASSVSTVRMVLNVNNAFSKKAALIKLEKLVHTTLNTLQIEKPLKLKKSILTGKSFSQQVLFYKLSLESSKSNIETFTFLIEPKR